MTETRTLTCMVSIGEKKYYYSSLNKTKKKNKYKKNRFKKPQIKQKKINVLYKQQIIIDVHICY